MPGLRGPTALLRLQSDERLLGLTRRGQAAAFEVLCARYQTRLLSFCRHMLGSREDAEDVLQEVFAAAYNAVLADDREINVRPWLYRIARNRSLNHLRRATATGVDSMDIHYAENGISTGEKVLRRESFRELIGDVHDLPETQRTALLLREIDALSYEQIGQAMETTIPSVKSLLVRARISLAEAAEARRLSCDEVRLELGEAAEGLLKVSAPARRHVRSCERCLGFKKQLKQNNHALAMIMPVGPLLMLKKVILTKLGSTASAGSAHATVGAGATVGATATAGATASGGAGIGGGLLTAGAGALATKAAAGLAAAAIVTAGAVAADHAAAPTHRHLHPAYASVATAQPEPVVVQQQAQPVSVGDRSAITGRRRAARAARLRRAAAALQSKAAVVSATAATPPVSAPVTATPVTPPAPTAAPVTEVTTEATQLPPAATTTSPTPPATSTTTETATPPPAGTTTTPLPTAEPVPVPEAAPAGSSGLLPAPGTGGTEAGR